MGPLLALCVFLLIPMGCFSQNCKVVTEKPAIREDVKPPVAVAELNIQPGYMMEVNTPKFAIGGKYLSLTEEVDYEKEKFILVNIICKTIGGQIVDSIDILVQITNVNDNEPNFKQNRYDFSILENLQVNSTIGAAVQAEDADQGPLYYELIGNDTNAAAYFRLTSVTYPLLVVNKSLDYDLCPQIWYNLTARDTEKPEDKPSFTTTTAIIIDIIDADDKPPFFQPCTRVGTKLCITNVYRSSVNRSELAIQPLELLPGPLYAVDGDYGINVSINYNILTGDDNKIFAINNMNGNITMNKPVNTLGTILLQVMAFQTNDVLKYSTTIVQIEVKEKNNFPPTFLKANYYGTIPANSGARSFVLDSSDRAKQLQVSATDADFPDGFNEAITYRTENSSDFIVLRDGYILTSAVIPSPGTAVLLVNATDRTTSESTTTIVTIQITPALITTSTTSTTTRNTPWTGTTTTTTPSTGTTRSTTTGTGTTTTTTPSTGTTTSTTTGTGTTTTTTPSTRTTTSTTTGKGTTTTTTPSTRTTTSTTARTGSTMTTTPSTRTTSTTAGTGTTTTTTPSNRTTTNTNTGTTTISTSTDTTTRSTTTGSRTTTSTTPGTGSTTTNPDPGPEGALQNRFYTATDMATLGATLGVVLVLSLVGLAFLIYKQYGNTMKRWSGNGFGGSGGSGDTTEQLINDDGNLSITVPSNLESGIDGDIIEVSSENNLLTAAAVTTALSTDAPSDKADGDPDSENKKVKSILTKDLKEDGGYKSVWFRGDAAPQVMVIDGAENGDANDNDSEVEFSNQHGEDDNEDDDDELDPTFNVTNNNSNNFSIL